MNFHNRYCMELPQDPKQYVRTCRQVYEACYTLTELCILDFGDGSMIFKQKFVYKSSEL